MVTTNRHVSAFLNRNQDPRVPQLFTASHLKTYRTMESRCGLNAFCFNVARLNSEKGFCVRYAEVEISYYSVFLLVFTFEKQSWLINKLQGCVYVIEKCLNLFTYKCDGNSDMVILLHFTRSRGGVYFQMVWKIPQDSITTPASPTNSSVINLFQSITLFHQDTAYLQQMH